MVNVKGDVISPLVPTMTEPAPNSIFSCFPVLLVYFYFTLDHCSVLFYICFFTIRCSVKLKAYHCFPLTYLHSFYLQRNPLSRTSCSGPSRIQSVLILFSFLSSLAQELLLGSISLAAGTCHIINLFKIDRSCVL